MRLPPRRGDDADIIRARLRALLADQRPDGGWLPADDPADGRSLPAGVGDDGPGEPAPPAVDEEAVPPGLGRHRAPGPTVRWSAGARGSRALWAAAIVAILVVLGWTWVQRPRMEPATASAAAASVAAGPEASAAAPAAEGADEGADAPATVVVSVVGLVARPGLVTLDDGARIADAVTAAGGLLPGADPASVNLAAPVADGQQIAVGVPGAAGGGPVDGGGGARSPGGRVDLNAAGVADLDALPGIGPVLAQRIVDHRTRNGPFRTVGDLDDVPGIGPGIAAELADLVAV